MEEAEAKKAEATRAAAEAEAKRAAAEADAKRAAAEAEAKRVTRAVLMTLKGLGVYFGQFHESHISALSTLIEVRTNCFSAYFSISIYFGMIYKICMAHFCTVPEFCKNSRIFVAEHFANTCIVWQLRGFSYRC